VQPGRVLPQALEELHQPHQLMAQLCGGVMADRHHGPIWQVFACSTQVSGIGCVWQTNKANLSTDGGFRAAVAVAVHR
jgi:hypothetical protein